MLIGVVWFFFSAPPEIQFFPDYLIISEGERIVLECVVTGWPVPDVKFTKDGEQVCDARHNTLLCCCGGISTGYH